MIMQEINSNEVEFALKKAELRNRKERARKAIIWVLIFILLCLIGIIIVKSAYRHESVGASQTKPIRKDHDRENDNKRQGNLSSLQEAPARPKQRQEEELL
jgi:hypothetical protein